MINLKEIPKVELHVHLDGSLNPKSVASILNIDENKAFEQMVAKEKCIDLNDYLTKFSLPVSAMQKKENLIELAREFTKELEKDNVIYAEVRFAPLKHTSILFLEQVIDSVLEGLRHPSIKINLILCMMRNDTFEENKKVIDIALQYKNKGVVAVDLAGAESLYKTESFKNLFDLANLYNIPFTIHAGEADGVSSIESALSFKTKRLGHGIRCLEDTKLLEKIKKENILLEVCPTSNVQTNVVDKLENHPIRILYDFGCQVCINTDNRTVSNVTLIDEYENLIRKLNFSVNDLIKMNIMAINNSFLNDNEKQSMILLIKEYTKYLGEEL